MAVKKTEKNIVKLDKNFHIYIHGRTDLIEKGVESDGRKFYKYITRKRPDLKGNCFSSLHILGIFN